VGAAGTGLLLAVLVPACGGSVEVPGNSGTPDTNGTPGNSGAPVAIEALAERLANAACENIAGCCHSAAIPFDLATCRANAKPTLQKSVNAAMRSNIGYDAAAAGACVAAYGDYFQRCFVVSDRSVEASCARVFVGTIPLGGACTTSEVEECAPTSEGRGRCVFDSEQGRLVCVGPSASAAPAPHGKLGEACVGSCSGSGDCGGQAPSGSVPAVITMCFGDEGLQCDFTTQTCQPLAGLGQVCSSGGCVAGAFCAEGVCAATKADGAGCTENYECIAGRCSLADPAAALGTCGAKGLATPAACSGNELLD
jgi:hypothetical protein